MTEVLRRVQDWYERMCDGEWEHVGGIRIDTLDNPGWVVRIDLPSAVFRSMGAEAFRANRGEKDWIACRIVDGRFEGHGGPANLTEVLQVFLSWCDKMSN